MKTVTVRIPVGIFADGSGWIAGPCESSMNDVQKTMQLERELSLMDSPRSLTVHWIEVPVPEPTEVDGRVE